jgi:hypothetical protein
LIGQGNKVGGEIAPAILPGKFQIGLFSDALIDRFPDEFIEEGPAR